jgi:hypothetical protein
MSNLFKSKKTETSKTEIDPQIYNRVLQNLQLAEQVAAIPYEPYRGLMVAPFTRDYMAGEAMTRRIAQEGGFVPEVEAAARSAQQLMGFQPERIGAERIGAALAGGPERVGVGQVAAPGAVREISAGRVSPMFSPERIAAERVGASLGGGPRFVGAGRVGTTFAARDIAAPGAAPTVQGTSFLDRDIGQYMNPYQQQVIEAGLEDIGRAEERARMARSQRATAARAFGGSRAAIEEGIAAGEAARERNRLVAEQRAQSFREAAALREADVGREQQARLANQEAIQRVMDLAQRGQISNQQRDIELSRLGFSAEQANVEAAMRADLANQQAAQEYMRAGLSAEEANQRAMADAAARNQQAGLEAQRMGLTAEQANVQAQLEAERANQAALLQREELAARTGQFNVEQGLRAGMANQQAVQDYIRMGLSAEEANQRAMMEAAQRNQAAGLEGAQFRLGAGRQLADFGQMALQNRYGAGAAMMGLGQSQQQLYQQLLNAQREEDFRRQQFPLQQLAIRQGAVSASPYNVTQTGTVTSTPSFMQMLGQAGSTAMGLGWGGFKSDMRMKTNAEKIKNPLDKINRLNGIEFEWEDEYQDENGEDRDMSVSAQDVEKVMPSAVKRDMKDGMREVSAPQLIGLLTEAIKELDQKVEKARRAKK